jgi:hypothetical protein
MSGVVSEAHLSGSVYQSLSPSSKRMCHLPFSGFSSESCPSYHFPSSCRTCIQSNQVIVPNYRKPSTTNVGRRGRRGGAPLALGGCTLSPRGTKFQVSGNSRGITCTMRPTRHELASEVCCAASPSACWGAAVAAAPCSIPHPPKQRRAGFQRWTKSFVNRQHFFHLAFKFSPSDR